MFSVLFVLFITLLSIARATSPFKLEKRSSAPSSSGWDPSKISYPSVQRGNVQFQYASAKTKGKVTVADPYNWLEKPLNSSEVQDFIKQQLNVTNTFLDKCAEKESIKQAIDEANNYIYYSKLMEIGLPNNPSYIFSAQEYQMPLKWYLATETELDNAKKAKFDKVPGKVILDESTLSKDRSLYVVQWQVTDDKKMAMFTVAGVESGIEIRLMDLTTLKILPDKLPFSGSMSFIFTPDGKGVIYDRQARLDPNDPQPKNHAQILYHKIGSDTKMDIILVKEDTKISTNIWYVEFTYDRKFMNLYGLRDKDNFRLYVAPLDQPFSENMKWISLVPTYEPVLQYVANTGTDFYFISKQDGATDGKLVHGKIDPSRARHVKEMSELKDKITTQDIIPVNKQGILENWGLFDKTKILLAYLQNAKLTFYVHDIITGKRIQQVFPEFIGRLNSIGVANSKQVFLELSSFTMATGIYRVRSEAGKISLEPTLIGNPAKVDLTEFKTEQHFATSKDGTKIPFDISYSKKYPLDGTKPAWLFAYGSFGTKTVPYYDPYILPWVRDRGGVAVTLQIRGGGEFGEKWHKAGMLNKRQNSFDDFQAVAEYMVKNKMAAPGKLIAEGANGGGTVAMVMGNQASPGLFGALLPQMALTDLLRFDKYPYQDQYVSEWGSPGNPVDFDVLHAYSPLHNIPFNPLHNIDKKKNYPATLLSPVVDDDANSPIHSLKMIAELQHVYPKNTNPLLMHILQDSGSSDYAVRSNVIKQCFVNQVLGLNKVK